jgi:hypothetical protein
MAQEQKQQPQKAPAFDEQALAEKLFVANYSVDRKGTSAEHIALLCVEAAKAYAEVRKKSY